jgi:hypothetical protein
MRFSNPTVRHSSTIFFRRNGNLRTQFFPEHDSEPQAPRLSSVKDVTATNAVQTHREFSPHLKRYKQSWLRPQRQSQSKTADGNQKLRTENRELGTEKVVGYLGCRCHGSQLFRLEFHQDSSYTSHVPGYGRWRHRSALERGGFGYRPGSLRAAEGGQSDVNEINRQTRSSAPRFVFVRSYAMACDFLCHSRRSFHLSKPLRHRPWSIIGGWRRVPLGRNLGHIWCGLCTPSISAKDNFKVAHYH